MNKIFKVVWSKTKNSYVVVSEIAKRNGKCSSGMNKKLIAAFLAAGTVLSVTGTTWAAGDYKVVVEETSDTGTKSAWGTQTTANVAGATAFGFQTLAGEGTLNTVSSQSQSVWKLYWKDLNLTASHGGNYATAFGKQTMALAEGATAWGLGTAAIGNRATAWGNQTIAEGLDSTAFGSGTRASGMGATAFGGPRTLASGFYSTAFGYGVQATNSYSVAFGNGSQSTGNTSTAFGGATLASGSYATSFGLRAKSFGNIATAFGQNSVAYGNMSTAFGNGSRALASKATAFGGTSDAVGISSIAFGELSKAYGENSLAALGGTTGAGTVTENTNPQTGAITSYTIEIEEENKGTGAVAVGDGAKALKDYTYAIGQNAEATEIDTIAIGNDAKASVSGSVAIGKASVADKGAAEQAGFDVNTGTSYAGQGSDTPVWKSTQGAVSVGDVANGITRRITSVAAGYDDTDAVNVAQLKATRTEIKAGDNITVVTTYADDGHAIYTLSGSPETVVAAGTNITVDGPETGSGGTGGAGAETGTTDKGNYITNTYTVNATGGGGANVKVIDGENTTVTEGKDGGFTTYAVNVKTDGKVASGDTGIVSGDTVYNETRVKKDGNYIRKDYTAAENITELDKRIGENKTIINDLDQNMRKGLAGAAALAMLHPMDFNPDDKLQFSAGVGNYRGETAAAIGAFYRPDESVMFSVGGTFGNSDNLVAAGVTFGLDGTRNRITRSRTAMAHEIVELRDQVAKLTAIVSQIAGPDVQLKDTIMFPDVPANHWAYEYVEDLQRRGALVGYPDGLFKGDRAMTRYEFAALLDRALRNGVKLDERAAKEFEPELGRIYVQRIYGEDNDRKKIERVRVNNEDAATRDFYGSRIVPRVPGKAEAK